MHDAHPHSHNHPHNHHHGHNAQGVAQWQTPHLPDDGDQAVSDNAKDLDLVETAFYQGFLAADDPVSFLRLSGIPLKASQGGNELNLLRVEQIEKTDLATLTPHLGGGSHSCDPLPARLIKKRKVNAFIYFDGTSTTALDFDEAKNLTPLP